MQISRSNNQRSPLPSIHPVKSIEALHKATELAKGRLVFVDVENVLTPLGGVSVDKPGKELVKALRRNGASVILASNMTDHERMQEIAGQVPVEGFVHKGMETIESWTYLPSKAHAGMFEYGAFMAGYDSAKGSMLIDDQLKNIMGAQKAGVTDFYWLYPRFFTQQDPRVLASRVIEVPTGLVYATLQKYGRGIASVIRGDHGEW